MGSFMYVGLVAQMGDKDVHKREIGALNMGGLVAGLGPKTLDEQIHLKSGVSLARTCTTFCCADA